VVISKMPTPPDSFAKFASVASVASATRTGNCGRKPSTTYILRPVLRPTICTSILRPQSYTLLTVLEALVMCISCAGRCGRKGGRNQKFASAKLHTSHGAGSAGDVYIMRRQVRTQRWTQPKICVRKATHFSRCWKRW